MNNWTDIICKLKDAGATPDEAGWTAIDAVFALLDGHVTRDEALAALRAGGVKEPERALAEVTDLLTRPDVTWEELGRGFVEHEPTEQEVVL